MDDYRFRPALPDDALDLARLLVDGRRAAETGIAPDGVLEALSVESLADDWRRWLGEHGLKGGVQAIIAYDSDDVARGFVGFGALRTVIPGQTGRFQSYSAEIYALYLNPTVFRTGLGTRLLCRAAVQLSQQGHDGMALWVLAKNKRAMGFYQARGGQVIAKHMVNLGGINAEEKAVGWRNIESLRRFS